jgi:BirA family biotin operon repressor/biotin-[acetyl-CoA-carboxylase] ligase
VRHRLVDSTNRIAVEAAAAGEPEMLVIVADEQSAGRGRRDRTWVAPAGSSLLCSILFRPVLAVTERFLVPSLVALAARDAIATESGVNVALKWPNDLVAGDRKLAGLLSEVVESAHDDQPAAIVVGIGINLCWPEGFPGSDPTARAALVGATTLEELSGLRVGRDELLESFLLALRDRRELLAETTGRRRLLEDYRATCATIGRAVQVRAVTATYTGVAVGLDDSGRLLVEADGATVAVDAADVVHLRPVGGPTAGEPGHYPK